MKAGILLCCAMMGGGSLVAADLTRVTVSPERAFAVPKTLYGIFAESCVNGTGDAEFQSCFATDPKRVRNPKLAAALLKLIEDLKPAVVRFPGGCYIEGEDRSQIYDWRDHVGLPGTRKETRVHWGMESGELGFYEYFCFCERLGAEPIPTVGVGMSCQLKKEYYVTPMAEMDKIVSAATDLLEFANGPADSKWGAVRARLGHPKPFGMKYLGVGNENYGEVYLERYRLITAAVRAKDPTIRFVICCFGKPECREQAKAQVAADGNRDILDLHFYMRDGVAGRSAAMFDTVPRNGARVYVAEWATKLRTEGWEALSGPENLYAALCDAMMLVGMERNSDYVEMSSYSLMFARADKRQWKPNMITVQGDVAVGSPSYYACQMFSRNRPDYIRKATVENGDWAFATTAGEMEDGRRVMKFVNRGSDPRPVEIDFGRDHPAGKAKLIVLTGDNDDENSAKEPLRIVPKERMIGVSAGRILPLTLPPRSLTVLRDE